MTFLFPPPVKSGFTFHQQGISHEQIDNCDTFQSHIENNGDSEKRFFLKMDVEGAEWMALLHMPESLLDQCNQIAIELHDLSGLGKTTMYPGVTLEQKIKVLYKLSKYFHCWHVHANNYVSMYILDGYKVPDVLEVTFVNKKLHKGGGKSSTYFPTKYDHPCHVRMKDHQLDFWPFYSDSEIKPVKNLFLVRKFKKLIRKVSRGRW